MNDNGINRKYIRDLKVCILKLVHFISRKDKI